MGYAAGMPIKSSLVKDGRGDAESSAMNLECQPARAPLEDRPNSLEHIPSIWAHQYLVSLPPMILPSSRMPLLSP